MRFTEAQIFNAGAVYGYLIAKQNVLFSELGDTEDTRRIVEGSVWEDFSRTHPKEAADSPKLLRHDRSPEVSVSRAQSGEGAFETPGARTAVGCGGSDSNQK